MLTRALACLAPALLLLACGGDDGGGATGTTPAAFCQAVSERVCAGLEACACRFDLRPYDAAGCVAARTASCTASLADQVGADVAAGRARFDEPNVTACLAAIAAMAGRCELAHDGSGPLPAACDAFVVSTAAIGEACALAGGGLAFCGATADGVCVPGEAATTCTALPGDGAACLNGLCAPGLRCNADRCAPPAALGASCTDARACAAGLVCDPAGRCAAPLPLAAGCTDSAQCQPGLTCDGTACVDAAALGDGCAGPGVCGNLRACGRAPETRTCDDPAGPGAACTDGACAAGLGCADASMTCVALPTEGQPCLDGAACAAGLTCADGVGTCARLPGVGETCAVGARFCADGLGCRPSDNTCQPGPGLGQECYLNPPDYVCGAGLGCDFGASGSVCVAIGGAGAACTNDRTCSADTFCDFSTNRCATRRADGAGCSAGNECRVGSECALGPSGATCQPIPVRDQPCVDACAAGLTCQGPGGVCVAELCVIP